jgi:NTE family protein
MNETDKKLTENNPMSVIKNNPPIKHLVISGGSVWGFSAFGIIYEAIAQGVVQINQIESIFMTSVGAIIGTMVSLKIPPDILLNYLVKRPWETLCKTNRHSILELYDSKGIIHRGFFENMFEPLFKSVDIDLDITMLGLYEYNGIEAHIYTTELNEFTSIDISFKTHPEWRVIDAVYASCCVPLFFTPFIVGDECYVDGGFHLNYPISKYTGNPEEVLAISLGNPSAGPSKRKIDDSSNIVDILSTVIFNVIRQTTMFSNDNSRVVKYQFVLYEQTTLEYCIQVLYNKSDRERLVKEGRELFTKKFEQILCG